MLLTKTLSLSSAAAVVDRAHQTCANIPKQIYALRMHYEAKRRNKIIKK